MIKLLAWLGVAPRARQRNHMTESIMRWLGMADQPAQLDPIDLFLAGHSIPTISAAAGQDIIREQRRIESALRQYILELEQTIADLRSERGP